MPETSASCWHLTCTLRSQPNDTNHSKNSKLRESVWRGGIKCTIYGSPRLILIFQHSHHTPHRKRAQEKQVLPHAFVRLSHGELNLAPRKRPLCNQNRNIYDLMTFLSAFSGPVFPPSSLERFLHRKSVHFSFSCFIDAFKNDSVIWDGETFPCIWLINFPRKVGRRISLILFFFFSFVNVVDFFNTKLIKLILSVNF